MTKQRCLIGGVTAAILCLTACSGAPAPSGNSSINGSQPPTTPPKPVLVDKKFTVEQVETALKAVQPALRVENAADSLKHLTVKKELFKPSNGTTFASADCEAAVNTRVNNPAWALPTVMTKEDPFTVAVALAPTPAQATATMTEMTSWYKTCRGTTTNQIRMGQKNDWKYVGDPKNIDIGGPALVTPGCQSRVDSDFQVCTLTVDFTYGNAYVQIEAFTKSATDPQLGEIQELAKKILTELKK